MSAIRLIVSDLDGTLLSPDHQLPADVLGTVQQYMRQGGYFTLATGRPLASARKTISRFGIELPVILCNGAVLAKGDTIIESHGMPAAVVSELLMTAHESGLHVLMFRRSNIHAFHRSTAIENYEHKEEVECSIVSVNSSDWQSGDLDKAILIGSIEQSRRIWQAWKERLNGQVAAFQSESDYLELVPGQVSKGAALLRLTELLDIRPDEVLAIGNQMNDLTMLQAAGIGAAVANSPQELKNAADYVCQAAYGQGVIEAIEHLVYGGHPQWRFKV